MAIHSSTPFLAAARRLQTAGRGAGASRQWALHTAICRRTLCGWEGNDFSSTRNMTPAALLLAWMDLPELRETASTIVTLLREPQLRGLRLPAGVATFGVALRAGLLTTNSRRHRVTSPPLGADIGG